jgi:uncharacterized phiE125 gp8 family phage protein
MTYIARHRDNRILDIQFTETDVTEPVSLDELKAHLQIDFDDDDTYLTALITACRQAVERYCSISLVPKTVSLFAEYYCERELPYGPVVAITSCEIKTGSGYQSLTSGDDYELDGIANGFQTFRPFAAGRYKIEYTAGYAAGKAPKDLLLDLKRICGYCYEHKGDEPLTSLQGGQQRPRGLDEALELFAGRHQRCIWL